MIPDEAKEKKMKSTIKELMSQYLYWSQDRMKINLRDFLDEADFERQIVLARASADRTGLPFRILSFRVEEVSHRRSRLKLTKLLGKIIHERTRINDIKGICNEKDFRLGVILYNTDTEAAFILIKAIERKFMEQVSLENGSAQEIPSISCDVYSYPHQNDAIFNEFQKTETNVEPEKAPVEDHSRRSIFAFTKNPIPIWKRMIDILIACFILLLLSPFFLVVAMYIKSVSKGPIFFKQIRVGRGNEPFTLWKFRTMQQNTDPNVHKTYISKIINGSRNGVNHSIPMTKLEDKDPQIIPFGNILRKSCIDELPQLINVVLGEMSIVGPRPPIPYEVDEYLSWHSNRLDATPGMTGLWQVSGKNKLTFNEMVRLDIQYTKNLSFWLDMKIMALTPIAIVSQIKDCVYNKMTIQKRIIENA